MKDIGTLDWARRTNGRMTSREQLAFARTGIASQLRMLPARTAGLLNLRRERLARLDLDEVKLPDTAAAREAEERCQEALTPSVVAHSHRTYLWGVILGKHDGLGYDDEMLYVSSLLHDVTLPTSTNGDGVCFTIHCADQAEAMTEKAGWDPDRRRKMCEALVLSFNPVVPVEQYGAEAHLLSLGAQLDVIGTRAWDVDAATREAVLERHPRHGFKREIDALLRAHAKTLPGGRVAFLFRYGAFGQLIKRAPFDE